MARPNTTKTTPDFRSTTTRITVRSWTLDFYQQVSNAKFFEFLEEARWNHFHGFFESGMFLDLDLAFVLVNVNINYRRPAFLGEVLLIETEIIQIGTKSVTLAHKMYLEKGREAVLDGEVTFVIKDMKKGVAVPITDKIRDMLTR